jgi:hypothetical protein
LKGHGIDWGHHVAEEAPKKLASAMLFFLLPMHNRHLELKIFKTLCIGAFCLSRRTPTGIHVFPQLKTA